MNIISKWRKDIRYLRKAYEAWQIMANECGWRNSFYSGRPQDAEANPVPWYTYPAIEFLRTLDMRSSKVFEYGCGNSSVFLAKRVKEIYSVESNHAWAEEVGSAKISNLKIITAIDKDSYINTPHTLKDKFDIIIVDGRYRNECAIVAGELIRDDGFIIFDNSDWYPDACYYLRSLGRFQLDFSGLGPIAPFPWTTSVFLKSTISCGRNEDYFLNGASTPTWRTDD